MTTSTAYNWTETWCITGCDMAVAVFPADEDPVQCASTVLLSTNDAEMCLMTPPRQTTTDTYEWTPTANLKLLLKAASPDLHSREMLQSQNIVYEESQSKASVTVPDVTDANDCSMHSATDVIVTHKCAENVTVFVDKQRRKDKSLGLLCEK